MGLVQGYDKEFFNEAVRSARRSERADDHDDPEVSQAGPAAAAIVGAEVSLEAFFSEALAILELGGTVAHQARKRIEARRSFYKRCAALYEELSGQPLHPKPAYDKRLVPLVKLRHCVAHRAANLRPTGAWPDRIESYRSDIDYVDGEGLDWTSQLLTARTARWAVRAAYVAHEEIHGVLPRETMQEKFYRAISTWELDSEPPAVS